MNIETMRALMPLVHRQDWPQDHLAYFPPRAYARLVSIRHFLSRR